MADTLILHCPVCQDPFVMNKWLRLHMNRKHPDYVAKIDNFKDWKSE